MAYEKTAVPIERSQSQLRKLLRDYGASSFEFGEGRIDGTMHAAIGFVTPQGVRIRMRVPLNTFENVRRQEQEERRIWRVLHWSIKARMESVSEGVETIEEAFLAHVLNETTNETVYEELSRTGQVSLSESLTAALPRGT